MGKNYTTNTASLKATTIDARILSTSSKIEVGNVIKDGSGHITQGTKITPEGISTKAISVEKDGVRTDLIDFVRNSINALSSTKNGGHGISVVQTNGVVSTTVTPASYDADGTITADGDNVVTAYGAEAIANKAAALAIVAELGTDGSIAQAIETAKQAAIEGAKVTVKTGTTTEEISELTLTDTSTSSDDIKISITPQSNTASDGKLNLKVSAATSTLAKKADTLSAEGKNTTVATGTAPEVKVVLGGTVSSPSLTVTATDVASASTLAALATTVNEHIAAKGGAITIQLADSLLSILNPSTEVIYLIPAADSKESNIKDEYIYVNGLFEKIGSTAVSLDGYATEDFVTGITDTKADKNSVVSSLNDRVGAIRLDAEYGLSVGGGLSYNDLLIRETTFNIYGSLFEEFTSNGEVTITTNTLLARASTELFLVALYINTQKLAEIERTTCPCEILVVNVDLPACTKLSGVTLGSKVSCPNLDVEHATNIKLTSIEAMLYFVDSLPLVSSPNPGGLFTMMLSAANEDIALFNELNDEFIAKGWPGVTLEPDAPPAPPYS